MKLFNLSLTAGSQLEITHAGKFVRYLRGDEPIRLEIPDAGASTNFFPGLGVEFPEFGYIRVLSDVDQNVQIAVHDRAVDDSYVSGLVEVLGETAAELQAERVESIGTTPAEIVPADPGRKTLHLRNNGAEPVALGSASLTWGTRAITLTPGEELRETDAHQAQWYACTEAASGSLVVLEGA